MHQRETLRNFLLAAFFAGLTGVGGILTIPMWPVPFTLQSFFVLMSGLFLGPKFGPLSQVIYIMMGLAGAPIFSGGSGGLQHVFRPTFGFLIAYVPVSWLAGWLASFMAPLHAEPSRDSPVLYVKYVLICLAATVLLYVIGLPAFYLNMYYVMELETEMETPLSLGQIFRLAVIPFILPDLLKALVAAWLAWKTIIVLRGAGLLPEQTAGGRHEI